MRSVSFNWKTSRSACTTPLLAATPPIKSTVWKIAFLYDAAFKIPGYRFAQPF